MSGFLRVADRSRGRVADGRDRGGNHRKRRWCLVAGVISGAPRGRDLASAGQHGKSGRWGSDRPGLGSQLPARARRVSGCAYPSGPVRRVHHTWTPAVGCCSTTSRRALDRQRSRADDHPAARAEPGALARFSVRVHAGHLPLAPSDLSGLPPYGWSGPGWVGATGAEALPVGRPLSSTSSVSWASRIAAA
jgi:hypothetical protein